MFPFLEVKNEIALKITIIYQFSSILVDEHCHGDKKTIFYLQLWGTVAPTESVFGKQIFTTKTSLFDPKNCLFQYSYLIEGHPVFYKLCIFALLRYHRTVA